MQSLRASWGVSPRFTFKHNQRCITTLTTPPGAPRFAISGTRSQVTAPWRLATESNPSLNGEGSARGRAGFEPARSQPRQATAALTQLSVPVFLYFPPYHAPLATYALGSTPPAVGRARRPRRCASSWARTVCAVI